MKQAGPGIKKDPILNLTKAKMTGELLKWCRAYLKSVRL
jgi:hypothetical protein